MRTEAWRRRSLQTATTPLSRSPAQASRWVQHENRTALQPGPVPVMARMHAAVHLTPCDASPCGAGHMGALPARQWYTVAIFCLTGCLLFADQNLMAPNLTAIAEDLGLSREERDRYLGGYIAAAFYAVGAPAALVFGYLSDHVNRRNLLFVAVLLGEGPCVLAYFVTRFWQLFVLRVLTGISLGGAACGGACMRCRGVFGRAHGNLLLVEGLTIGW